jgi:hypothetical protein
MIGEGTEMTKKEWATKNGQPIGAWVFKANPDLFDALADLAETGEIRSWSVQPNYRIGMFQAGQPALLWITAGKSRSTEPGFYAYGEVTEARTTHDSWTDDEGTSHYDLFVNVQLRSLVTPVPKSAILEIDGLDQIEPIHAPQVSNPMVLHEAEYTKLSAHFDLTTKTPTAEQLEALAESNDGGINTLFELFEGDDTALFVFAVEDDESDQRFVVLEPDPSNPEDFLTAEHANLASCWEAAADTVTRLIDAAKTVPVTDVTDDDAWDALLAAVSPGDDPLLVVKDEDGHFRLLDPVERRDDGRLGDRGTFDTLPEAIDAAIGFFGQLGAELSDEV